MVDLGIYAFYIMCRKSCSFYKKPRSYSFYRMVSFYRSIYANYGFLNCVIHSIECVNS